MNIQYATSLLGLPQQFSTEELKRNYRKLIFQNHPDRFQHLPKDKQQKLSDKVVELGEAFSLLLNANTENSFTSMNFDFGNNFSSHFYQDNSNDIEFIQKSKMYKLSNTCYELKEKRNYGLCIRLYEIGINKCLTNEYKGSGFLYGLSVSLGFLLFQLGLFTDGIKFFKLDDANYYLGNTYFLNEEYENAIKHWNYEFINRKTCIDEEGLYLKIVRAYFLLNEYKKCIEIVENFNKDKVVQKLVSAYAKYTPQLLHYSVYMLEGKIILNENEMKNKYPVIYKYITKISGSYPSSAEKIKKIVSTKNEYDKFIKRVKPKDTHKIKDKIDLDYDVNELKIIYEEIFNEPYLGSTLIMH